MPPKKVYKKLDPITHILERSDMYVGSKRLKKIEEYIAIKDKDSFKIIKKYINSSPAILRIFVEVLSNAIDNVERSKNTKTPCTTIKVNIDKETGETSVWNDGDIIPIEIHDEEKIYNHSLIFGNLMAGSNYNDEEERLIAGRNGLGSKCQIFGTKVPCFDGSIKNVEDIKIGEYLIGDDGKKREVLNTIHGFGEMYEVSQSRGDSYTVNSEHILSLRMPDHKVIYWSTEKQGWQMVYLDAENKKIHSKSIRALKSPGTECPECGIILSSQLNRHYRRVHKDKEIPKRKRKSPTVNPPNDCEQVRNAYIKMQKFAKTITDNNTIDISIQDYLKSNDTFKSRLTGYKSECVQWERKKVDLDPYVLGLWLGDGYQHGRGFAINAEDDYEILEYLKKWGEKNDAYFTHLPRCKNCKENKYDPKFISCKTCAAFSISSIENRGKIHKAPLRNLLKKYDLLKEKFIPIEYKVNDRDTRLKVLAGLIDSDGHVSKEREGRRITISQGMMHEKLADDILYLARSLGFSASKIIHDVTWTYENEKRSGKCISINISGNGLEDIPTLLPRKKCSPPLSHEVLNTGPIKIKKVENGKFVGLTIDGNQRFVINDFTVTHNCTNVFSTKFIVKGLDPNNGKILEQTWTNNMRNTTEPKITSTKLKSGFTKITYFPDFKQFELEEYTDDIIELYTKYVIDSAMLTKIKVYLNDELIPVNNLETYSQLYETISDEKLLIKNKQNEVLICPANINEFQHISFVNGVYTRLGGVHVDIWSEAIFRPLVEKFNKKDKPQVNIKDIKQFFRIFIVSTIPNPEFSSQDKVKLEAPKISVEIKQTDINKLLKWSVIEEINDIIKMKEMVVLKKSEKKKKGYTKVEGLDSANNAGGKLGYQCSLILCEGLSAKTYAIAGIQKGVYNKAGRDYFGVLALKGKCVALDTPILLWNGEIKKAQDIKVGDILVNDMGEQTTVLQLFSGTDTMYEVQQLKGENYTVNSEHTLTLKVSGNFSISWSEVKKQWKLHYFDKKDMKMKSKNVNCIKNEEDLKIHKNEDFSCEVENCNSTYTNRSNLVRHYREKHTGLEYPKSKPYIVHNKSFLTKEEGFIKIYKMSENIDSNNIIDINIKDYLKLDNETKHLLKGFKLNNYIKWDKKQVYIDPYILGMWLGDGLSNGFGFSGEDIVLINEWYIWCIKNNCEIVHNNRDSFTIRKKDSLKLGGEDKRINIGSPYSSNENCRACHDKLSEACSNDKELKKMEKERVIQIIDYENKEIFGSNPLREALKKYNLIDNKHVPVDYIINDKETRLQLLAGFIDTDGHVGKDGRIEISQSVKHKNMLDSLLLICRSLGFYCYIGEKEASYIDKNGKRIYKDAYRLYISGNGISEIPTKLNRKKLDHIFVKDSLNTGINIVEKGLGQYVGFMTDKTHRFLLGDFTVTHNCLNVRNSIPATIAKNKVITDLIQALNLRHDLDYTDDKNYKTLSYGKVILLTDADCFTNDTALLVKRDNIVSVIEMEDLFDENINLDTQLINNIEVWSDKGWVKVRTIRRKKTSKKILTINTYSGLVSCTKDHKLLLEDKTEKKAFELKVGDKLLTKNKSFPDIIAKNNIIISQEESWLMGLFLINGSYDNNGYFNIKCKNDFQTKQVKNILEKYYNLDLEYEYRKPYLKSKNRFFNKNFLNKRVPSEILNNTLETMKSYLDGCFEVCDKILIEGHIGAQELCYLCERIGYSIEIIDRMDNYYIIEKTLEINSGIIKSINERKYENRFVYDIETETGVINAGIGNIIQRQCDGLHISGLLMNFFHYLFPSLLEREDPFIVSMCTPIVRVFNPKADLLFYDENKFRQFAKEQQEKNKTFKSKYYKGLGTTKPEDVPDTFGRKMIEYKNDDNSSSNMNKIFHKKFADTRKEWLANYELNPDFSLDDEGEIVNMEISSFLNNEVIKFSHNDCKRSIPSLFDGLKESQRKCLYAVKKRNLTYSKQSLKVAQLGGYVAEHTNYHHGEQNLFDTIINMAQDFVGSNNIPLFYRDGMFGTRLNGKDAASPRYIFTKMETITPFIFREEDDILLEHVIDDGDVVEPKFYVPIIPMILVNGAIGIGTGWSCNVPQHNPIDIIECIKIWLENDGEVLLKDPDDGTIVSMFPEITPWYRGFEGKIEKYDNKYITYGIINKNKDKVEITELPINMWTDNFKEKLEDLLVDKQIKNMKNYSTPNKVNFILTESEDGLNCNLNNLGLYSYLHTTNMVLINEKEQLKKYNVDQIIDEFCIMRYSYYVKRKKYNISTIEKELKFLGNKERFITEIINKKLNVMNVDEDILIKELEKKGYDKIVKNDDINDDESDNKNGYNYLLKLPVRTLTSNQVNKIKNDIQSLKTKLEKTIKTSEKDMWLNELKEFEIEYEKWLKNMENMKNKSLKKTITKKK